MAITLYIRPAHRRPGENPLLRFNLIGFVGELWISLPFETRQLAKDYCLLKNWPVSNRS
jgi:hypothetical protein